MGAIASVGTRKTSVHINRCIGDEVNSVKSIETNLTFLTTGFVIVLYRVNNAFGHVNRVVQNLIQRARYVTSSVLMFIPNLRSNIVA